MKKPFNPKRNVSAGKVPKKKGLSKRNLELLGRLQEMDLGEAKVRVRLWKLKYEHKVDALIDSMPERLGSTARYIIERADWEGTVSAMYDWSCIKNPQDRIQIKKFLSFFSFFPNTEIREGIVEGIGKWDMKDCAFLAKRALNDSAWEVRCKATRALFSLEGVPFLIRALNNPHKEVRHEAINLLGWAGVREVIPLLEKILKDLPHGSGDRANIKRALERIRARAARKRIGEWFKKAKK